MVSIFEVFMACESKGANPKRINQFNKIKLWNEMANMIAGYGVQCGNQKLLDYIDMNCGGIPEGPFEQVVDLESPHQFLQMYTQIAEKRFAFAVTSLLKMNPEFINQLTEFCGRIGREMGIPSVENVKSAYAVFDSFYLDGMPCDETRRIISDGEDGSEEFVWEKLYDTHAEAWNKAGGDLNVYYDLLKCFAAGLLSASHIVLDIEDNSRFVLHY